jgi:hypothetical protein
MKPKAELTPYGLIGDFVEIKWRDSNIYLNQCRLEEIGGVAEITSSGDLIAYREREIVLASDKVKTEDGVEYRRIIVIPEENVIQ